MKKQYSSPCIEDFCIETQERIMDLSDRGGTIVFPDTGGDGDGEDAGDAM